MISERGKHKRLRIALNNPRVTIKHTNDELAAVGSNVSKFPNWHLISKMTFKLFLTGTRNGFVNFNASKTTINRLRETSFAFQQHGY